MLRRSDLPTYEVVPRSANIPAGWDLTEIPVLAIDSQDRILAFTSREPPVVVFGRDGTVLTSSGSGQFQRPHAICIGPGDALYCLNDFAHSVRKYPPDGKLLMSIGPSGSRSDTGFAFDDYLSGKHGGSPYNRPPSVRLSC